MNRNEGQSCSGDEKDEGFTRTSNFQCRGGQTPKYADIHYAQNGTIFHTLQCPKLVVDLYFLGCQYFIFIFGRDVQI